MNNTKRQHFIPCCYLKFFSRTGDWKDARKTEIWFTDGTESSFTAIDNLGVEKYTYSKKNLAFDQIFNDVEDHYPQIIEKLLQGAKALRRLDYFGLIMIIGDFHLRNVAYENRSEVERMHVYEGISRSFNSDLFAESKGGGTNLHGMKDWLEKNWRIKRIKVASSEKFITSDNPSTIFNHPKTGRPVMLFLPAHPRLGIVAYDHRYLEITSDKISDDALGIFNGLQINRCVRHTFSDHDLSKDSESWTRIKRIVSMDKPARWIDINHWKPDYISIASPAFNRLSFVSKKNPLIEHKIVV